MSTLLGGEPTREAIELAQLRRLRLVSLIEGTTLASLVCVAVPLKHLAGWPIGSSILGPVHGLAFLAYLWTVIETASGGGWSKREIARLVAVGFVPFGGFTNGGFLERKAASFADAARSAGQAATRSVNA